MAKICVHTRPPPQVSPPNIPGSNNRLVAAGIYLVLGAIMGAVMVSKFLHWAFNGFSAEDDARLQQRLRASR